MMVESILECSQEFGGGVSCAGAMPGGAGGGGGGGGLPQWKRELLQRRAARRPPPAPPTPPPPPPPAPPAAPASVPAPAPPPRELDEEELRYGPGIVKRLKSRYLSLALREAPRRRPSVLRRAASLEHLLDDRLHHNEDHPRLHEQAAPEPLADAADATPAPRPEPAPAAAARATARPPRPASLAAARLAPPARRDLVKRARSVDALSRLEPPYDPPAPRAPEAPPLPRGARPPRRPAPLLRDAERPPPDVVRAVLRKFEPRRAPAPTAPRVAAALRGLDAARTSTPEPRARSPLSPESPGPPADLSAIGEPEPPASPAPSPPPAPAERAVSRQALEGIARAGCSTRYSFDAARRGSHLPPLATANPVLVVGRARRVGVIRPMPAPPVERALTAPLPPPLEELVEKLVEELPPAPADVPRVVEQMPRAATPPPPPAPAEPPSPPRAEKRSSPPSAVVEPIPRLTPGAPPSAAPRSPPPPAPLPAARSPPPPPEPAKADGVRPEVSARPRPLVNGHVDAARLADVRSKLTRIAAAHPERGCNGVADKGVAETGRRENGEVKSAPLAWARGAEGARVGRPPPAATSVVFNFSSRKEVPDYVENDGLILRASRRDRIKAGEPGVVVLRPELVSRASDSEGEDEVEGEGRSPSPCAVRFVNDNVLINGRSSMPTRPDRTRIAKLKLQFDDSLTRTFEYPSETSLCEDAPDADAPDATAPTPADSQLAEAAHLAPLAANTHMASAALSRYTPSKTLAAAFQLGVSRRAPAPPAAPPPAPPAPPGVMGESAESPPEGAPAQSEGAPAEGGGDARPCGADAARSWSESRALATDLLF